MLKIGLSGSGFEMTEQNFEAMKRGGLDAIEYAGRPHVHTETDIKEIKRLANKHGLDIWTYHLQYYPAVQVHITSDDPLVRKQSIKRLCYQLERGADVGIDKFVIHPCNTEHLPAEIRAEHIKRSTEALNTLDALARKYGAYIAVEELPRTCLCNTIDEMKQILASNDRLRVCFDVNHLFTATHTEFFKAFGDKIITVHISDCIETDERHWMPGEGVINWDSVMQGFKNIGYSGVFMYEVRASKTDGKTFAFSEFFDNAKWLFSK